MDLTGSTRTNDLGQPVGWPLDRDLPWPRPRKGVLEGRFCRLEPANPEAHGEGLQQVFAASADHRIRTYLHYCPFDSAEWPRIRRGFQTWLSPENFDGAGRRRRSLAEIRETPWDQAGGREGRGA